MTDQTDDDMLKAKLRALIVESVYWDRDVPERVFDAVWPLVEAQLGLVRAQVGEPVPTQNDEATDFDRGYECGISAAVFIIRACSRHGSTPEAVHAFNSMADLVEKMGEGSNCGIESIKQQMAREAPVWETQFDAGPGMVIGLPDAALVAARIVGLVRTQTLAEAADAIDADAAGRLDTHQAWLRKSAELVRGL